MTVGVCESRTPCQASVCRARHTVEERLDFCWQQGAWCPTLGLEKSDDLVAQAITLTYAGP